jgi:hypothetical protein
VIRPLPHNTPAEDISDGLVSLGFYVISVKQMTATRRSSSDGSTTINLPLFLITLAWTTKSLESFRLQSQITISVEACRAQNGLTQCHNCQQFAHVRGKLQTTSQLLVVRRRSPAPRKGIHLPPQHAATVGWRKEKNTILQIIGAADTRRMRCRIRALRRHLRLQGEGCYLLNSPLQACHSRRPSEVRQRQSSSLRHIRWQVPPQWNPGSLWPYVNKNSRK